MGVRVTAVSSLFQIAGTRAVDAQLGAAPALEALKLELAQIRLPLLPLGLSGWGKLLATDRLNSVSFIVCVRACVCVSMLIHNLIIHSVLKLKDASLIIALFNGERRRR